MDNIINLGAIRISRGKLSDCSHKNLTYDPAHRLFQCADCNQYIDRYDATMIFRDKWQEIARRKKEKDIK